MEIRHFKLVKTVSEEKTLTRAAQKLHLSQSALSHQLRDLEKELRMPVFNRINKKLVLTQAGHIMLQSSKKILEELNHTQRKIEKLADGEAGTIRLSTECYTSYHWLPPIIKEFKKTYPQVEVEIKGDGTEATIQDLLKGELDIALIHKKTNDTNLKFEKLLDDKLVAIFSEDHPFREKSVILPADFKEQNLISHAKDFKSSTFNQKILKRYNIVPAKIMYIQLTGAVLEMVRANLGVTVLPRWIAGDMERKGLKSLPITRKGLAREWIIATLKNQLTTPHTEHFIELLKRRTEPVIN